MGLEAIGLAMTIGSGVMSVVNGFVQSNAASDAARETEKAERNNYYSKASAEQRYMEEQAVAQTAATSTRLAEAKRQLGTLQVVMGHQGLSGSTFDALAMDITNSESLDVSRMGTNYQNQLTASESRTRAAGQDYVNTVRAADSKAAASGTAAWLNVLGTGIKIGGDYVGNQMKLNSLQNSYDAALDRRSYDASSALERKSYDAAYSLERQSYDASSALDRKSYSAASALDRKSYDAALSRQSTSYGKALKRTSKGIYED